MNVGYYHRPMCSTCSVTGPGSAASTETHPSGLAFSIPLTSVRMVLSTSLLVLVYKGVDVSYRLLLEDNPEVCLPPVPRPSQVWCS